MVEHSDRMPVVYLPHGGGPWPFVSDPMGEPEALSRMADYMRGLSALPPRDPTAVLLISAHWEERVATVMTSPSPPMLYDYYGFAPEAYEVTWPAPGSPTLAARVRDLLSAAGIDSAEDARRGFDHGTFVPMKLAYPNAEVPTTQLSLVTGLDPSAHLAIGRALAPLRDEGVFIVGSGMSYHNLRAFFVSGAAAEPSREFDAWLTETTSLDREQRDRRLAEWESAPSARACHPREEHLLPLMVIAGAAGVDRAHVEYRDVLMGAHVSAHHFG